MGDSLSGSAPAQKAPTERAIPATRDKREHPRFKVEGATAVLGKPGFLAGLLGPKKFTVINLSQGGALVRIRKRLPVGSRHPVRIEIPKYNEVIETQADILWCGQSAKDDADFFVGIRFTGTDPLEQKKVAHMYELFTSAEYRAKATARREASSPKLKPPRS